MTASAYVLLRALAVQLRDRAAALDDRTLPPELQAILDRCRDDLAVILAATRSDTAASTESAEAAVSFEALRALFRVR